MNFILEPNQEYIALSQLLKFLGLVDTGGEAFSVIDQGEVILNGEVEYQRRKKIRNGDVVIFNETEITILNQ